MLQLSLWSVLSGKGLPSLLHRSFCVAPVQKADKELLKRLRKRTGFPFIRCKYALEKFDNNLQEAEKWMQQEALKQGWTKAGKLANRPMSQGLIGIRQIDQCGVIVEANCETDFVARNSAFQNIVSSIIDACMQDGMRRYGEDKGVRIDWSREELEALIVPSSEGKRVADIVAMCIGTLGENMRVRRAGSFRAPKGGDFVLTNYCHTTFIPPFSDTVFFGSYGSLLLLRKTSRDVETTYSGRNLCQHIVGMNPSKVGNTDVDKPSDDKDDETIMLFQPYLLDEKMTVDEYAKVHGVVPIDFIRYQCGESLPGDDEP